VLIIVIHRYDEIIAKLTPFLKQTGFNPKTDVYFMPVSGYTGANIKDRSSACSWYNGPSLLEYLDDLKTLDRKLNAPLMIPVAEKYKVSKLYSIVIVDISPLFHRIWVRSL
jgi:peptide chain release factor subunit 3